MDKPQECLLYILLGNKHKTKKFFLSSDTAVIVAIANRPHQNVPPALTVLSLPMRFSSGCADLLRSL